MNERLTKEKMVDNSPWREGSISIEILNGTVKVFVERSGRMIPVIVTFHGGITSHAVHRSGINLAIEAFSEEGP